MDLDVRDAKDSDAADIAGLLGELGYRITSLSVAMAARGHGVGRTLVDVAERRAGGLGAVLVEVSSGRRPDRAAAHRFYPALAAVSGPWRHTRDRPSSSSAPYGPTP